MDKKANFNAWYIVVAVLGMLVLQAIFQQARRRSRCRTANSGSISSKASSTIC